MLRLKNRRSTYKVILMLHRVLFSRFTAFKSETPKYNQDDDDVHKRNCNFHSSSWNTIFINELLFGAPVTFHKFRLISPRFSSTDLPNVVFTKFSIKGNDTVRVGQNSGHGRQNSTMVRAFERCTEVTPSTHNAPRNQIFRQDRTWGYTSWHSNHIMEDEGQKFQCEIDRATGNKNGSWILYLSLQCFLFPFTRPHTIVIHSSGRRGCTTRVWDHLPQFPVWDPPSPPWKRFDSGKTTTTLRRLVPSREERLLRMITSTMHHKLGQRSLHPPLPWLLLPL